MNDSSLKLRIAKSSVTLPVGAGDLREPLAVLGVGRLADPPQVARTSRSPAHTD